MRPERAETKTPGETLRAARLRRRISLAEAEQATRIRQRYLEALEDDDHSALPPGVYSRGFLRNYAIFLGVPPDEVTAGYRDRRRRERKPSLRSASPIRLRSPRVIWFAAAAGALALVVATLVWLGLSAPEETPPRAAGAPAATATSRVTLPPLVPPATPTTAPALIQPAAASTTAGALRQVEVELRTTDRAWIRATVDGQTVLEETLPAGQARQLTGKESVALLVGNAGAVDLTVNGQRIGALGAPNQAVEREFTR